MAKESVERILKCLPGVDCGGCGLKTCTACAEAISDGASITLCPAADTETVAAIAAIMGTEPVPVEKKVAYIKCAGEAAGKKRLQGSSFLSCDHAKENGFAKDECIYGCLGLGTCIEKCKFGAMSLKDGQVIIDHEKCTGCQACVTGCVQKIIEMVPADATNFIPCSSKYDAEKTLATCSHGCIGCGDCAFACPKGAISMMMDEGIWGRYAKIDYDKCEGCMACTVKCRKKIIVDTQHDIKKVKEAVALVRCTGGMIGHQKLVEAGYQTCHEIVEGKVDCDALDVCEYGCLGFGDCSQVCRFGAISNESGIAKVDPEQCVGCGDCIRACPMNKIQLVPLIGVKQGACQSQAKPERRLAVCASGCIDCKDCEENCPTHAIEIAQGFPEIDYTKCVNCGICQYVCSRGLLNERIVPEYNYLQLRAMALNSKGKER